VRNPLVDWVRLTGQSGRPAVEIGRVVGFAGGITRIAVGAREIVTEAGGWTVGDEVIVSGGRAVGRAPRAGMIVAAG
jgi:hypothetical protein